MTVQIEKRSLDKRAADAIRDGILDGSIALGTRLKEIELSNMYGLARSTIRAALRRLANEGLVNQMPYKGWSVFELTAQDIWELYTLRASLEALAASLAAKRVDDQVRQSLLAVFHEFQSASVKCDSTIFSEADFQVHRTIVEASSHKRLQAQYKLVEQQIRVLIMSSNVLVSEPSAVTEEHRLIVDAVLAGAAEKAAQLASEHCLTAGRRVFRIFADSGNPASKGQQDWQFGVPTPTVVAL